MLKWNQALVFRIIIIIIKRINETSYVRERNLLNLLKEEEEEEAEEEEADHCLERFEWIKCEYFPDLNYFKFKGGQNKPNNNNLTRQ